MNRRLASRLPVFFGGPAGASRMNRRTKRMAAAPRTSAAMKAARMPATRPSAPISAPPMTGPSAIGIRRTKECTVTPMVRFSRRHGFRDHAHDRGQRDRGPGDEEQRPDEHRPPGRHQDHEQVPEHGHEGEEDQRPLVPEPVGQPAPGERVERGQQVVHRVQRADRDGAAAERHEVEREEPLGHLLAEADEHHEHDHGDHARVQAEECPAPAGEVAEGAVCGHGALHSPPAFRAASTRRNA